jgi:phosphatidylglycerol:prolipoprotein diacylglycerol transferase
MGLAPNIKSYSVMHYFHPTFLYESLWNLLGFIIINALYKKKKFDGQVFLMYITWYGFGRMLIEGLRTDSLYVGVFRISQVVGFACFVVGTILLIYNLTKARRAAITAGDYDAAYPKLTHKMGVATEAEEYTEATTEKTEETSEAYEKRLSDLMSDTDKKEE